MEWTGEIKGITQDFATGKFNVTLTINEGVPIINGLQKLMHEKLNIEVKKHRNKRSLDANAYMWQLLQKMAEVLQSDKDSLYIEMLGKYGVFTHIIVKPHIVDKVKAEWRNVKELGEVIVNGTKGIQLQCYFGSSTYDTKEMSVLIDGIVSECKELDIETLPEEELTRMKSMWGC